MFQVCPRPHAHQPAPQLFCVAYYRASDRQVIATDGPYPNDGPNNVRKAYLDAMLRMYGNCNAKIVVHNSVRVGRCMPVDKLTTPRKPKSK